MPSRYHSRPQTILVSEPWTGDNFDAMWEFAGEQVALFEGVPGRHRVTDLELGGYGYVFLGDHLARYEDSEDVWVISPEELEERWERA